MTPELPLTHIKYVSPNKHPKLQLIQYPTYLDIDRSPAPHHILSNTGPMNWHLMQKLHNSHLVPRTA